MNEPTNDFDPEAAAINIAAGALINLPDDGARERVMAYLNNRFRPAQPIMPGHASVRGSGTLMSQPSTLAASSASSNTELPGIARLLDDGSLKILARDLKAKSALDAAVRLSYVAIHAYSVLSQGGKLSSRKGLTQILKQYRLYDGNVRARLARERGIVRDGDNLSLDAHATTDAERYMGEITNAEITGQWKPK